MLSKALVFVFTVLGVFALLLGTMPGDFIIQTWNPNYRDAETKETFDAADVLMYDNADSGKLNYSDAPIQYDFGLSGGQKLEIDWVTEKLPEGYWAPFTSIYLRHLIKQTMGYWTDYHNLNVYDSSGVPIGTGWYKDKIIKANLVDHWDSDKNATILIAKCDHITTNIIFQPRNSSWSIGDSWDQEKLNFALSYDVNWNATGVSAWTIVAQLLTFQAPDLGIGGVGGIILNAIIAIPTWSLIAYIVYKIVAGIIPFISGGGGD